MRLFYCDESGTAFKVPFGGGKTGTPLDNLTKNVKRNAWYVMCAVSIDDVDRQPLNSKLWDIKKKWLVDRKGVSSLFPHSPEAEIKGNYLLARMAARDKRIKDAGEPEYEIWKEFTDAEIEELLDEHFRALEDYNIEVHAVAVDQREVYRRFLRLSWFAPYIALSLLWNLASHSCRWSGQQALFVVDAGGGLGTSYETNEFFTTREQVRNASPRRDWWLNFDQFIVEEPLAVDSRRVQIIQLADLFAYTLGQCIRLNDPKWSWFERIEPLLSKHSRSGLPGGVGLTFYPQTSVPSEFRRFFPDVGASE